MRRLSELTSKGVVVVAAVGESAHLIGTKGADSPGERRASMSKAAEATAAEAARGHNG